MRQYHGPVGDVYQMPQSRRCAAWFFCIVCVCACVCACVCVCVLPTSTRYPPLVEDRWRNAARYTQGPLLRQQLCVGVCVWGCVCVMESDWLLLYVYTFCIDLISICFLGALGSKDFSAKVRAGLTSKRLHYLWLCGRMFCVCVCVCVWFLKTKKKYGRLAI